jgi:chromosome partitioning protein
MGKIVGVCNQKGGTGKTTTAINLTSYLGLANKKILIIDMDPQGNATSGLGFNPEGKHSIYDVISANTSIKDSIYSTQWPGISIIPSHISLTGGEIELVNIEGREMRLRDELHKIKEDFSYHI